MGKLDWSGICATSKGRNQCCEENCILFKMCLIKDISLLTSTKNNQKQNVPKGVSNPDTLGINIKTASSDEPQKCSGQANVAEKEDTSNSTLPADLESNTVNKLKRKVVCVFGKFDDKSDFVLEPSCPEECNCDICDNAFWIEEVKE